MRQLEESHLVSFLLERRRMKRSTKRRKKKRLVGVTEEVMVFARNIATHRETWLDFPLFNDFEDTNDFEMSDTQQEHAMAAVSLEPRLAALRIELCVTHMSEGCFWKIYFILLHSRLNKHDTELLSTPQELGMLIKYPQNAFLRQISETQSWACKKIKHAFGVTCF